MSPGSTFELPQTQVDRMKNHWMVPQYTIGQTEGVDNTATSVSVE